ncbi:hypothetical protein LSTR_LSTR012771 [Laodelphax striatellus]|uniref:Uncharacterized protein n=1 Tax=Laodelphax striatellus TaxID=195883 RepID=A0A482X5I8_LAOST|nr:hypothetical protein LSTR_LSTR012771 [Laodelphax striatellus]
MARDRSRRIRLENISRSFVQNTSLHGIKYMGDARRHLFERAFWSIILIIFISCSSKYLFSKWWDWRTSPMVIKTSNIPYSISSFPVPAITVCDAFGLDDMFSLPVDVSDEGNILYKMNFKRFVEIVLPNNGLAGTNRGIVKRLASSNGSKVFRVSDKFFLDLFNSRTFKNQIFIDSKANSDASLASDGPFMCYDSLTLHGYCFTCNIAISSDMFNNNTVHHYFKPSFSADPNATVENLGEKIHGFPSAVVKSMKNNKTYKYPSLNKSPINTFTHKTCGEPNKDDSNECKLTDQYKSHHRHFTFYTIHSPWDVPSPFMRWYYDKKFVNKELQILVDATSYMLFKDEASIERQPEERRCLLPLEKPLVFFKYYTRRNCLLECFTQKILDNCDCVLYFLPHTEDTDICEHEDTKACAYKIMDDVNVEASWVACGCFSACNHTEYRAISREVIPQPNKTTQYTMVFRDDTIYPKIRRLEDTLEEVVVSSMTFLDMFLGVSLISLGEIAYYSLLIVMEYLGINRSIRRSITRRLERKQKRPVFTVDQCPKVDKHESECQYENRQFETNNLKKRITLLHENEF